MKNVLFNVLFCVFTLNFCAAANKKKSIPTIAVIIEPQRAQRNSHEKARKNTEK